MAERKNINEVAEAGDTMERLSDELKSVLLSIDKSLDVLERAGISSNAISEYHGAETRIIALLERINLEAKMATMMNCVYAPPKFFGRG